MVKYIKILFCLNVFLYKLLYGGLNNFFFFLGDIIVVIFLKYLYNVVMF